MADEIPQQLPTDWAPEAPPATPDEAPPAWDEIKSHPDFGQLNPNQQITAFQHWRNVASNFASKFPDYNQDVQKEFNDSMAPEQQRLADAATTFNTQHPELPSLQTPVAQTPEGFWGTLGRAALSRTAPAIGTAAGAVVGGAGGAAVTPELGGLGAVPGAIGLGIAGGLATEEAQKTAMGPEWYERNRKQMEINAQEHPVAHQIGTLLPFLASSWTGSSEVQAVKGLVGKVVNEESGRIAKFLGGRAEQFITGGIGGGSRAGALQGVEEKGEITPQAVASGAGRGIATLGAVALVPVAKTILGQAIKGVPDAVVMGVAGELYDSAAEGRPFNFKKVADETKGSIAPFVLQNALLGFLHGAPLRGKSAEAAPPESKVMPTEADFTQRQAQLEAMTDRRPDQEKELENLRQLQQMKEQQKAPIAAAPTTPEAAPAAAPAAPEAAPAAAPAAPEAAPAAAPAAPETKQAPAPQVEAVTPEAVAPTKQETAPISKEIPESSPNENVIAKHDAFLEQYAKDRGHESYDDMVRKNPLDAIKANDYWKKEFAPRLPAEAPVATPEAPKETVAPERVAKATEGRPEAPLEQVTKGKEDSAKDLWNKALDEGREPTIQEWQKAAGKKGGPALRDAYAEALKQTYPGTEEFSNNTKDIAERLNRGETVNVPKEAEENLNPNINITRAADGTAQVTSVDHPDYGTIRNPGDLDKARAPEVATRRAAQKTADIIPEKKPEYAAKTQELLSIATEDQAKKLNDFMRSHNYDDHELHDEIQGRALRAIVRGQKPNNNLIQLMIQKNRTLGKEVPLPTAESGKEIGTQPEEITGETHAAEAAPAAGTAPAELPAEAAATPHEQTLRDSGIKDPKGFLDQVNEQMRQQGKPEMTMEQLASLQQKASDDAVKRASNSGQPRSNLPVDPDLIAKNGIKLADMGALDTVDPLGKSLEHLSKNGTPLQKLLSNILLRSGIDTSRVPIFHDNGMNSKGVYDPLTQKMHLNLNSEHGESGIEGTLLHEALHHITVMKFNESYRPTAYEAIQIQNVNKLLAQGRQAAMKEILGRAPTKEEVTAFEQFYKAETDEDHEKVALPKEVKDKLWDTYNKYYGLSNGKELIAEASNPEFVDFMSSLPADKSLSGRAANLYHQIKQYILNLVAGRPVAEQPGMQKYLETIAAISQDTPEGRLGNFKVGLKSGERSIGEQYHEQIMRDMHKQGKTIDQIADKYSMSPDRLKELHDIYAPQFTVAQAISDAYGKYSTRDKAEAAAQQMGVNLTNYDQATGRADFSLAKGGLAGLTPERAGKAEEAKPEEEGLRWNPGKYASIMREAGVPYVGNFLGTHEQMAKDAQDELAKNPNAANERLALVNQHNVVPSAEDFHLFRAQLSQMRQEYVTAKRAGDAPAAQAAETKAMNWMQKVYDQTAKAGKALQSVQGALDINTGDFFDLKSFYKMVYGKEFTPKQEKNVEKIVTATTQARVDTLTADIKAGQEIAKTADGTINELGEAVKGTKLTSAEKKAAAAAGVSTGKDAAGKDTGQLDFGWKFDPAAAGKKLSEYLNQRFEFKPYKIGQKNLTTREVGQIWQFIKANYLQGTEYVRPDELVKDVAADLKIDKRIVKEAIAAPKTVRQFLNDRYKAQSQQRAIVNATRGFMENADKGKVLEYLSKAWEAPRSLAVIGHVNPSLTHAGSLLFRPSTWKQELPSIAHAFKASFLGRTDGKFNPAAYHERMMQDVMDSESYGKLTSLGLAAKVGTLDDMGQYNTFLGRVGVAGNRGMDTLKSLRMQLGEKEYKRLKGKDWFNALDEKGKDDVLREAMSRINTETGTTTPGHTSIGRLLTGDWRTFLFAPRLEGARWQQMVIDPLRAAGLALKMGSATDAEKYFRRTVLSHTAEQAATMLGALAGNAAILKAIGSDDKINWLDPTRSDWLAFKVNGQTVIAPSSFLAPLRLSLSVALAHAIPAENRQPYTDKIINYAMGKVTPSIADIVEIARAKQQYTGRPIEALQNLYEKAGVKFSVPRNPKDPIPLYEWALTKGPIPLAATTEGWYNALVDQGTDPVLAKTIIGASIAMVGSIFAVHQHPTPPEKEIK